MKLSIFCLLSCLVLVSCQFYGAPNENYDLNDGSNVFRQLSAYGLPRNNFPFHQMYPNANSENPENSEENPENQNAKPTRNANRQKPTDQQQPNILNPNFMNPFAMPNDLGNNLRNIRFSIIDPNMLNNYPGLNQPNQQFPPPKNSQMKPKANKKNEKPTNNNKPANNNVPNEIPNLMPKDPNNPNVGFYPIVLPNGMRIGIVDPSLVNLPGLNVPSNPPRQSQPKNEQPSNLPKTPEEENTTTHVDESNENPTTENASLDESPESNENPTTTNPLNQPRKASPNKQPIQQISSKNAKAPKASAPKSKLICTEEN